MKKFFALLTVVTLLCMAALPCAMADESIKVGIIQMMDHVALTAAQEGFVAALKDKGYVDGEKITITYQNGQGDMNNLATIADKFVSEKMDIILAIATPSAQAIAGKTADIPIIATAITDFVEAGLIDSDEKPGTNVSGTSDMNPIDKQIELMFTLYPDTKKVGFLYNSSEANSVIQVNIAKAELDKMGIAYTERTVSSTNEVQQAMQTIIGECDAIYLPTDNIFASSMPIVGDIAMDAKIPVICGESGMVDGGGLATLGLNYFNLGYQAGEMAVRVIEGEDITQMPIERQKNFDYCINGAMAEAIGLTVPDEFAQYVK